MFSDLNLYYLKQMGITPWINKNDHASSNASFQKRLALLIVTPSLKLKERSLLSNICSFLSLQEDTFVHLETDDPQQHNNVSASFYLLFGFNVEQTSQKTKAEPLDYLLSNPLAKKNLFRNLLVLKEQLAVL